MAIAKIEITCAKCGSAFTVRKECRSRREADSYELWAAEHIHCCPECSRKDRDAKASAALEGVLTECGFVLPMITGVSDKQIAYAESIRARYLTANQDKIRTYRKVLDVLENPETATAFRSTCEEYGMTLEEGVQQNMDAMELITVKLMLTGTAAKEIIESKH